MAKTSVGKRERIKLFERRENITLCGWEGMVIEREIFFCKFFLQKN